MAHDTTKKGTTKTKRRSRRIKGGLFPAGDVIDKTLKRLNLKTQFDEHLIQKHYPTIVGADIAKKSYPEKIIKGTLFINVTSSAWLMHLSFMKDELKKKINDDLGKRLVRRITFKVGTIPKKKVPVDTDERLALKKVKLDDTKKKLIKESVKDIKDTVLKRSIIAAETAYYKRKQIIGK